MRNITRSCVALGLIAIVTTVAFAGPAKAKVEFAINLNGVTYLNIVAGGPQSQIKGSGNIKIGKSTVYPMTVDSGTYSTTATGGNNNNNNNNNGGATGGGNGSVAGTVTLNGFIKKQGKRLPYILVGETSTGDSVLSVQTTSATGAITVVDTDFTGRVTLKF